MKVLIVDDHELFRSGLCLLLKELSNDMEFCGLSNVDGLDTITGESPSLVLLDYYIPGVDGPTAIAKIQAAFPMAPVVILSGDERPGLIRDVLDSGASGFIPKSSSKDVLVQALKLVLAGGIYLPPEALKLDDEQAATGTQDEKPTIDNRAMVLNTLSSRQRETTLMAIRGASNRTIAEKLNISEGTVKAHLSLAYKVMGVRNRTEALLLLAGLESLDEQDT